MAFALRYIWLPAAVMAAMAAFFLLYPQVDIELARFFYHPVVRFQPGRDMWLWKAIYLGVPLLTRIIVLVCVGILLLAWLKPRIDRLPHWPRLVGRQAIFVLMALTLGPGLVVNGAFKEHWGRARPSQLVEFGGDKRFTPAWHMADQCESNCSFTSGHAAIGFFPMAMAWLFVGRRRHYMLVGGMAFGLLVGFARMSQGAHFLSDVLFSGWAIYFTSLLAYWLVFVWRRKPAIGA
jgi:lipid A 4'-phosphatase